MKRFLKRLCIALAALIVTGSGVVVWKLWPRTKVLLTDADAIRVPSDGAAVRDVLWRPAEALPGLINTADDDYEAEISEDGMTLFFVRGRPGKNADIYVCQKDDTGWGEPLPLAAVNSEFDDLGPELSIDGRTLYFYSNREGSLGGFDLWMARRGESGWREPVNLGRAVNSPFDDYGPGLSPDQGQLYFASNRPRPEEDQPIDPDAWRATLRVDRQQRDFDLYATSLTDAGPQPAVPILEVNTPFDEGTPTLSPFGDFLYFASNRPGGAGGFDIYRSRRVRGTHELPTNLGDTINTIANEMDPELSLGGYGLHFSSDRSMASDTKPDDQSHYDIYYSASREVFREVETQDASIDWAALWRTVGPNLLWALLALTLLALLAALMRDFKDRRLSLLARCLFASLMAHMLLMLIFNVWQVGSAVARAFNGREKIQVSLVSAAVGEQIFSQVRGDFTNIAPLTPDVASIERAEPEMNQPNLVEPIEPLSITSLDSPPTQIHDASKLEMQVVMDAAMSNSATECANENESLNDALQVEMEFADIAVPAVDEREVATESTLKFHDEFPAVVSSPAKLEIASSQPVIERIDLAESSEPPATAGEVPTSLLTNMSDKSSDAAISGAPPFKLDSEPVKYVQFDQSIDGSDFAIPFAHESGNDAEEEAPLAVPMAVASSQSLHADADDLMETQVAAPPGRVEFEPATAIGAVQMSPESLAASEVADSETSQIVLGLPGDSTEPLSGAADLLEELALTLPGAEATQSAQEAVESSIIVAPKAIQGQHVNLGMAEADSTKVEPIAVARFEPAKSNRSDGEPMKLPEATPVDANVAAQISEVAGSRIAAIESDLPALDLSLPAENAGILPPDAVGIIRGRILDAESMKPLANGLVRLVMPDDRTIEAPSDDAGNYSLYVPPTPEFFALTASRGGYLPKSTNIRAGNLSQTPMIVDFELQRQSDPVIALEEEPDVHHLGNDLFEGRINSKFQREAEGRTFISLFNVSREQLDADYSSAEIRLLARGVQCAHPIRINGRLLRRRLDASPSDGSFGEFIAEFDPHWLIEGENSFKIRAQSCRGDLDDFEFVNIQIRFLP